jgi:magnesium chelatase subunit D
MKPDYPFSAILGCQEAKLALMLCLCDPLLGGVLLFGDKGSAKTTLARGFRELLPGNGSFVNVPINTTEDRLIGSIDVEAFISEKQVKLKPGLVHKANKGILYIDEINLLADHLVDMLLDVAVTKENIIERDGLSVAHEAKFVLVGSMNKEEGNLRPQLLDRFGLSVEVVAPQDPEIRAEIVKRRLLFDKNPALFRSKFTNEQEELKDKIARYKAASLDNKTRLYASKLCNELGVATLRGDIMLCRAAAAFAGLEGRKKTEIKDIERVMPLVLGHRTVKKIKENFEAPSHPVLLKNPGTDPDISYKDVIEKQMDLSLRLPGKIKSEKNAKAIKSESSAKGRGPEADSGSIHLYKSALNALLRARETKEIDITLKDLSYKRGLVKGQVCLIFVVDASSSMAAKSSVELAKSVIISLLNASYLLKAKAALIVFNDSTAQVALHPTSSPEIARSRLEEIKLKGKTPLDAGIKLARDLAGQLSSSKEHPYIVFITDARPTEAAVNPDLSPWQSATLEAKELKKCGFPTFIISPQPGDIKFVEQLAEILNTEVMSAKSINSGQIKEVLLKK